MTREKIDGYIPAAAVWLTTFIVYRWTMAPTVGYIDSGELSAVAATLGNAHSTGYPLYTLLGRCIAMLPVADTVIMRMNILSGLLTASAALFFYLIVIELLKERKGTETLSAVVSASISSILLAFSRTYWLQGVSAEVYALHLLLVTALLLWFVKAVRYQQARWWFLFAFFVGLAFTNHMTTILLAPALIYWFIAEHGWSKDAVKRIGQLSVPFLGGLSLYSYLPVRASTHPPFNWGNPQTFDAFWWHITGKQFRVWMFSGTDVIKKQFDHFTSNLPAEFHPVVLLIAIIGIGVLFVQHRRLFNVAALLFVTCVLYSVNYDIHDIDTYFLLAFIVIAFCTAFGFAFLIGRFDGRNARIAVMAGLFLLIPLQLATNWDEADQSDHSLAAEYTQAILTSLPRNAVVISAQWDYFVSPSYYFQRVEHLRPDVTILDKELFRRSWYFPQLRSSYPELMRRSAPEIEAFLRELYKFEHDLPYDGNVIEARYAELLRSFMVRQDSVPVFVTPEIEPQYVQGFLRVPEGFLLRLVRDTLYIPDAASSIDIRPSAGKDKYTAGLTAIIRNAYLYRAEYERYYGSDTLAQILTKNASKFTAFAPSSVSKF